MSVIFDRRARVIALAVVLIVIGALGTIVSASLERCPAGCPPVNAGARAVVVSTPPPTPAAMAVTPILGARDVDPLGLVSVTATAGTLTEVSMINEQGTRIVGIMTPDNTVWKPGVPLGYGRTYTLTVTGRGTDGTTTMQVSAFSTLTPRNQTKVYLNTTAGTAIQEGGIYGIGTVAVAYFDEPITDRAAAERRLSVHTSPAVPGSWYWLDDQHAHGRPQHYFRRGNVRTMPTSMGMGGSETIGGQTISFWTQLGIYTVMDKANPVVMDSSTFGLPINSRLGYRETIKYATRISTDGIYLHQLDATVWAQGNTNVSHGCLNLNADNAIWFFEFSQPGDIVEVRNTGGEPLAAWQNGDWSVPWDQWLLRSALA